MQNRFTREVAYVFEKDFTLAWYGASAQALIIRHHLKLINL